MSTKIIKQIYRQVSKQIYRQVSQQITKKISTNFLIGVLLAISIILIYAQTWQYDSVCYDDPLFLDNPHVRQGLCFESIKWAFTDATSISNYWIPLTWLSFILDFEIFGNNPGGFHFTNTLFHLLNSILLFNLCLRLFKSTLPSVIASFLFALHPIHVESVAWITCRKDVLCCFFWILGLFAYCKYVEQTKFFLEKQEILYLKASYLKESYIKASYIKVMLFFFMGLMSKPMILTFPFVLLLLDFYPLKRVNKESQLLNQNKESQLLNQNLLKLFIEKIPFFLIVLFFSVLTYFTQKSGDVLTTSTEIYPLTLRFLNSFIAYVFYIKKLIYPVDLSILYPYPEKIDIVNHSFSVVLIVLISLFCYLKKRSNLFFLTGWLWFLGTLVPVIGIYIVGVFLYTDRYAYIPLIGIYIIIGSTIEKFIKKQPNRKKIAISLLVVAILLFGCISFMQVTYWKNSLTLFERAIYINPKSSIAYNNLGYTYKRIENFDKATLFFLKAIELTPNYFLPYYNLAGIFYATKQYEKAIFFYKKSIKLKPEHALTYFNIGLAFMNVNSRQFAIESFSKCIEIDPNFTKAHYFLKKISH